MSVMRFATVCALLVAIGCAGPAEQVSSAEVFTDASSQTWTAREFTCLEQDANGQCNKKTCKTSSGGAERDSASGGKACIDTGNHYEGTKDEGTCTRVTK